ncbi:MAG: acetolactate synthase [Candidatus Verstraetearchaeota archaeon]|nr:acetolactate synthase [Candidatus Verstraetearchaeota archaeon]
MKQLSVFLENRPGRLANLLKILEENKIKLLAMGIAEAGNYGIVRMIVDKFEKAIEVLRNANMAVNQADVIIVDLDRLTEVAKLFGELGINIDYAYSMNDNKIVLKVDNEENAIKILNNKGIKFIA